MFNQHTNTEPIKIYREGKLDRRAWIADRAKVVMRNQLTRLESASEAIFVEHRLPQ
jgi:hypothetical protein